ncbi:hypothetical protein DFH28DRAFT_1220637 [Melampsora americana]|nr:hypothetical protein DFH28DRAFT_1220637 [Melampsora americana]
MDLYTRVDGNRPFGLSPLNGPATYTKNARINQRRVLGNITNFQPPTLPTVKFSHVRSNDVEWVDDSVNHAHHPPRNSNRHDDHTHTYNFTQESPLKYAGEGVDSVNRGHQHTGTGTSVQTRTVELNDHDDSLPGPYEICQSSRAQGPDQPEKQLRDFSLLFIYCTKKPVNPTKGFTAPKGRNSCSTYFSHELKGTRAFDLAETNMVVFKKKLFKMADEIDEEEDSDGISSILEGADVSGRISIQIFIPSHNVYSKGKTIMLKTNDQLKSFFNAVELVPQNDPGIIVTMEDPSKQALQEEKVKLSKCQAKLVAQSIKNTGNEPSNSELAIMIPEDPTDVQLALLMKEYGTGSNNTKEGYRVHHATDNCMVMQLTFEHLYLWARELAKGTTGVTLHNPPNQDGFKWEDIRRPLETTTPMRSSKRLKGEESTKTSPYSQLQGHFDCTIDRALLEQFKSRSTLGNYLLFASVPPEEVEDVVKVLQAKKIRNFDKFLFPEIINFKNLVEYGVDPGIAFDLMYYARDYYQFLEREHLERAFLDSHKQKQPRRSQNT